MNKTIGFIGGGRVARILLTGWKRAGVKLGPVTVSDINPGPVQKLKAEVPEIADVGSSNKEAATKELVFLAVHPPALGTVLEEIKDFIQRDALVVSLAPKFSFPKLKQLLGGFNRLARVIPNAPSIIGAGYNPIAFEPALSSSDRQEILQLFKPLGDCPEVPESNLEAYALLTAMGPTYLWFQFEVLREFGKTCGLTDEELVPAIKRLVCGSARTLLESGLSPAEVMNLVPVKPLAEDEPTIKAIYQNRLPTLYSKIKP